ncbi:MAG: hypothetical protein WA005_17550 [Candidatus Binataceae bacterium]
MGFRKFGLSVAVLVIALGACGCSHRLVAGRDEHTVKVYQNEEIYKAALDIRRAMKGPMTDGQRSFVSMLDGMVRGGESKDAEQATRVRIIARDSVGARVELLEGPFKGYQGFVPKQNLR